MDPERFRQNLSSEPTQTPQEQPPAVSPLLTNKRQKGSTKSWRKWAAAALVLVVLVGLSVWAYTSLRHKTTKPPAKTQASHTTAGSSSPQASASNTPAQPTVQTTPYTASVFNTSFDYPSGWTIVNNAAASLNVDSPAENIVAANGQTVLGQIVFTLTTKGQLPAAFTSQSVAVLTSQKITFASPSTTQAAQSYISFVQYPTTTIVGGLDGIYISGNYGYQKDQAIPATNLATVDPLVYISFYTCQSQACPANTRSALTVSSSDWNNSSFSAPLLTTLKSFTFD